MSSFPELLAAVKGGARLGRAGASEALNCLVSGYLSEAEISDFLLAHSARPVDEEELIGFASALRGLAVPVPVKRRDLVDTCGTGGDGLDTFNISTAAALAAAGAGAGVAKHGNRSSSSRCGSADLLEASGVPLELEPDEAGRRLDELGFAFLFAPRYHPAMKAVGPARRALKKRTIFNLLGPLANPAPVTRQVVGIYAPTLLETYARVLLALGATRVMVVHAEDGMDELSLCAPTRVCHGDAQGLRVETVSPDQVGLLRAKPGALAGGDAARNLELLTGVLAGQPGPLADATVFNAAAALVVSGRAEDLREGVERARQSLSSGAAAGVLEDSRRKP